MDGQIAWNCMVGNVNRATARHAFSQVGGRPSETMCR